MTPLSPLAICLVLASHMTLAFTNVFHTRNTYLKHASCQLTRQQAVVCNALSAPNLDDTNYKQILFADSYDKAVLVDACAPWCGPCKLIEKVLETCAEKWSSSLDLVKYDVEAAQNPNLKLELLMQNVMPRSLPCLLLFQEGKVVTKHSGVITEEELDALLETHLGGVMAAAPSTKMKSRGAGFVSMVAQDDSSDDYMLSGSI